MDEKAQGGGGMMFKGSVKDLGHLLRRNLPGELLQSLAQGGRN